MSAGAESRVLILSPGARDARLAQTVLQRADIAGMACADAEQLCAELEEGAGAALVAEESLIRHSGLTGWLRRQPPWSDLPLLVLARPGADSTMVSEAVSLLGNVTVLERPMRVAALVSAVRSALRARQRQYQIREHLAERELAATHLRLNDRRKDEFLAILAHELRNPLAPISNALQLLRLAASAEPRVADLGAMMERQVGNLRRLVEDLLEVSRITRGKIELRREPVELVPIVRIALETSQPLIEAARHRLHVRLPEVRLPVQADPVRLAQVFANLLNNAAKFTPPGGDIHLELAVAGDAAVVTVRDSGIGIPAESQARIFELFAQADPSFNRTQGGLGIGLTLVRQLVELHGGSVTVSSAGSGRGSEFTVRLPLAQVEPAATPQASTPATPVSLRHHSILVVDDNHDAADSLALMLGMLGAQMRVAYSGTQALDILNAFRPTAAILDIGMQGMDGLQLAREIRAQPHLQKVPLIALTGWGQHEDVAVTRRSGFDHHLVKPVSLDTLEKLLAA